MIASEIIELLGRWFGVWRFNLWRKKNPLTPVLLEGQCLSGLKLKGVNLSGADLRNANLSGADLRRADLSEANLTGTNLTGANLAWARLNNATLIQADLRKAILHSEDDCDSPAVLNHADLREAHLEGVDLSFMGGGIGWDGPTDVQRADFRGAHLAGADLEDARFFDVDFSGADLRNTNISATRFCCCNLRYANLTGARRRCCPASETWFIGADLSGAVLVDASLYGANFGDYEDLRQVSVEGADMREADLRGTGGLPNHRLIKALHLETARLAAGRYQDLVLLGYQPTAVESA